MPRLPNELKWLSSQGLPCQQRNEQVRTSIEARVNELLPPAAKIAREFENIPGLPFAEIELAAQEGLAHAARLFDPAKGDFTAYAARAMRNTLRDLYERQVRHHHHHHVYDLDLPVTRFATTPETRIQQVPAPNVLTDQAAALATLREKLEAMGFQGLDTIGLLKSGCGVSPQTVLEASRFQSFSPQVDDFSSQP